MPCIKPRPDWYPKKITKRSAILMTPRKVMTPANAKTPFGWFLLYRDAWTEQNGLDVGVHYRGNKYGLRVRMFGGEEVEGGLKLV
jgi:hypothetical protein